MRRAESIHELDDIVESSRVIHCFNFRSLINFFFLLNFALNSFARMPVGRSRKSKLQIGTYPTVRPQSTHNVSDEEGNTESDRNPSSSFFSTLDSTENANFYKHQNVISNQPASDEHSNSEINRLDSTKLSHEKDSLNN